MKYVLVCICLPSEDLFLQVCLKRRHIMVALQLKHKLKLDLSSVSNWIFHFSLVRITVSTWSKEFRQVVLCPNTQSKVIYDSYTQFRNLYPHLESWKITQTFSTGYRCSNSCIHLFQKQKIQMWIKSMCMALTVPGLLGIVMPFGKRVISVTCQ